MGSGLSLGCILESRKAHDPVVPLACSGRSDLLGAALSFSAPDPHFVPSPGSSSTASTLGRGEVIFRSKEARWVAVRSQEASSVQEGLGPELGCSEKSSKGWESAGWVPDREEGKDQAEQKGEGPQGVWRGWSQAPATGHLQGQEERL